MPLEDIDLLHLMSGREVGWGKPGNRRGILPPLVPLFPLLIPFPADSISRNQRNMPRVHGTIPRDGTGNSREGYQNAREGERIARKEEPVPRDGVSIARDGGSIPGVIDSMSRNGTGPFTVEPAWDRLVASKHRYLQEKELWLTFYRVLMGR
jgi:hypothetical protein